MCRRWSTVDSKQDTLRSLEVRGGKKNEYARRDSKNTQRQTRLAAEAMSYKLRKKDNFALAFFPALLQFKLTRAFALIKTKCGRTREQADIGKEAIAIDTFLTSVDVRALLTMRRARYQCTAGDEKELCDMKRQKQPKKDVNC